MAEPRTRDKQILFIDDPGVCDMCVMQVATEHYHVRITDVGAEDASWIVRGEVRYISTRCPRCAKVYEALVRQIPIEAASFICSNCKGKQNLKYRIRRLEERSASFE